MRATLTGQTPSSSPDSSEAARRQTAVLRSAGLGRVKANAGPCEQAGLSTQGGGRARSQLCGYN